MAADTPSPLSKFNIHVEELAVERHSISMEPPVSPGELDEAIAAGREDYLATRGMNDGEYSPHLDVDHNNDTIRVYWDVTIDPETP